jgi:hypothetical protein
LKKQIFFSRSTGEMAQDIKFRAVLHFNYTKCAIFGRSENEAKRKRNSFQLEAKQRGLFRLFRFEGKRRLKKLNESENKGELAKKEQRNKAKQNKTKYFGDHVCFHVYVNIFVRARVHVLGYFHSLRLVIIFMFVFLLMFMFTFL